jgi:hypothetical protein
MGRVYLGHIDPGYLWDRFDYKPLTGELVRRYTDHYGHKAGTPVGSKTPRGYLITPLYGRNTFVHRIIYAWVTGAEPAEGLHIHHIDHNPSNNAWNNLAVVTPQQHKRLHSKKQRLDDMW